VGNVLLVAERTKRLSEASVVHFLALVDECPPCVNGVGLFYAMGQAIARLKCACVSRRFVGQAPQR